MADPLTYSQRLKLGAIRVRRDFADQARRQAIAAALLNDYRACEMLHAEADQHEAAIIAAAQELGGDVLSQALRFGPRIAPVAPPLAPPGTAGARVGATAARVTWRGPRETAAALARPFAWQESPKLG